MSPLENNITNLTHKEQVPDEIDLFDIIRFLIVNRVFILLGLCLGALFSLSYITYRHFYSSTTTTTTTIPVKATGIAQNEFYSSLNLAYINPLFKVPDDLEKAENKKIVYNAYYYLNKKLNPSSATTEPIDTKPTLINSLEFLAAPSGYELVVKTPQENIDTAKLLEAINYASNEMNKSLLVSLGENTKLVETNNYIAYKNKLILNLFTTQIQLKELILPLQYKFESIENSKISSLFEGVKMDNLFLLVKQVLEQKPDFTKKDNFNNLIAELEINQKITAVEANQTIRKFLDLDRLLTNQTAKLTNFPVDKILPLFESVGTTTTEPSLPTQGNGSRSSAFLIFIAALILGSMAGVFVAAGKAFYKRFKIEFRDKVTHRV